MVVEIFTGAVGNAASAAAPLIANSFTVGASATVLASSSITENQFDYILVNCMFTITQTAASNAQNLNFDIIDANGPTTLVTIPYLGLSTPALRSDIVTLLVPVRKNTKGTIQVSLRGATADANTTIVPRTFILMGIDVGRGASGL